MQSSFKDREKGDIDKERSHIVVDRQDATTLARAPTKGRTAIVVVLTDKYLVRGAKIHGERYLNTKRVQLVKDWKDLFKTLLTYESIKHLVLYFHGSCADLHIGGESYGLSHAAQLFNEFVKKQNRQALPVEIIEFNSCNVGRCPDATIDFVKLFNAQKAIAWNHFLVKEEIKYTIDKGMAIQITEKIFDKYKDYFLPKTPSPNELVKQRPGEYYLWLEWAQSDNIERYPPLPPKQAMDEDIINWIQEVNQWKRFCKTKKACKVNKTIISGGDIEELRKNAKEVRQRYEDEGEAMLECEQVEIDFKKIE